MSKNSYRNYGPVEIIRKFSNEIEGHLNHIYGRVYKRVPWWFMVVWSSCVLFSFSDFWIHVFSRSATSGAGDSTLLRCFWLRVFGRYGPWPWPWGRCHLAFQRSWMSSKCLMLDCSFVGCFGCIFPTVPLWGFVFSLSLMPGVRRASAYQQMWIPSRFSFFWHQGIPGRCWTYMNIRVYASR